MNAFERDSHFNAFQSIRDNISVAQELQANVCVDSFLVSKESAEML